MYCTQGYEGEADASRNEVDGLYVWESDDSKNEGECVVASKATNYPLNKLVDFICGFLLLWQVIFKVPDFAITVLFKLLKVILQKLSYIFELQSLKEMHEIFSNTLAQAQNFKSINCDNFRRFVVCQQCHSTYTYEDVLQPTANLEIKRGSYTHSFPRHIQRRMRAQCSFP